MQRVFRKAYVLLLFFLIVGIFFRTAQKAAPRPEPKFSFSPTPLPVALPSASPLILEHHCVSNDDISHIAGKTYELIRETQLPEINALECQYEADDQVRNVTPSLYYFYKLTSDQQDWQDAQKMILAKPSYRRIEGKDYMMADVNPVVEISQTTFYAHPDNIYIELTYSPIDEEVGIMLDKGMKFSDIVLGKGS